MLNRVHSFLVNLRLFLAGSGGISAQGMLNGNFEIYNSGAKFLEGWNVKLVYTVVGLTNDYGMVVGGKSGSRVGVMDLRPEESTDCELRSYFAPEHRPA